jgi:hypothetical protein
MLTLLQPSSGQQRTVEQLPHLMNDRGSYGGAETVMRAAQKMTRFRKLAKKKTEMMTSVQVRHSVSHR